MRDEHRHAAPVLPVAITQADREVVFFDAYRDEDVEHRADREQQVTRISQMAHGDLGTSRKDTLRKYVEATGGELEVSVRRPDGSRAFLAP